MDITREQLAKALDRMREIYSPGGAPYKLSSDVLARELLIIIADTETGSDVVDAHICCEHADADPELSAMAALLPALPLVAALKRDARERVMDWARRRATDGLPPF
jgi:hypothetical protein